MNGSPKSDALPNRWFAAEGVDFVNLGDIKAFMLAADNLYRISVPEACKRFPIDGFYREVASRGYARSPVSFENLDRVNAARHGLYLILWHMIRHGLSVDFLDVGAFVGDVGMRYANFFRTLGHAGRVFCFDPSVSGELIPYNIQANGLERWVQWVPQAVSDYDGFLTFYQRPEHSDSSSASIGAQANTIVQSGRLSTFMREQEVRSAFIKLDTENLERRIVADVLQSGINYPHAFAIEFHAAQQDMQQLFAELLNTYALFDVGYIPHPFVFNRITPQNYVQTIQDVARRPWGYTDVVAISSQMPNLAGLCEQLGSLAPEPMAYSLYLD